MRFISFRDFFRILSGRTVDGSGAAVRRKYSFSRVRLVPFTVRRAVRASRSRSSRTEGVRNGGSYLVKILIGWVGSEDQRSWRELVLFGILCCGFDVWKFLQMSAAPKNINSPKSYLSQRTFILFGLLVFVDLSLRRNRCLDKICFQLKFLRLNPGSCQ